MKVISGYGVFCIYFALKLHFISETYDYFKYKGKLHTARYDKFIKRKDKHFFEQIRKLFNYDVDKITQYIIANLVNDKEHVSDFDMDSYLEWSGNIQATEYNLKKVLKDYNITQENIKYKESKGSYPLLFDLLLKKKMNIESFILLDEKFNFLDTYKDIMPEPYLWEKYKLKCKKYKPFMEQYV